MFERYDVCHEHKLLHIVIDPINIVAKSLINSDFVPIPTQSRQKMSRNNPQYLEERGHVNDDHFNEGQYN